LEDPALQLGAFAFFVQQAGLTDLLASTSDAFTLFAPSDKVSCGLTHCCVVCGPGRLAAVQGWAAPLTPFICLLVHAAHSSRLQAFAGFMSAMTPNARHKLLNNATLADQLVTAHLVLGMALGSAALEALLPAGQLKTPQGSLAVLPANR
jgi:uncharacterized surface protein with fasciclin (FAS1) repeats